MKFFSKGIGLLSTRPGPKNRIDDPNSTYIVEIGEPMMLAAAFHSLFDSIFFYLVFIFCLFLLGDMNGRLPSLHKNVVANQDNPDISGRI